MSFSSDLTSTYGLDLLTGSQAVAARAEQLLNFLFEEWQLGPTLGTCLLYTSPSPRDRTRSRMPSSA